MATIINLTNTTNTTNIYDLALNLNSTTGGTIGVFILFSGFLITLISLKNWESKDAFAAASFSWSVFAFLFFLADLVGIYILSVFWSLGALGIIQLFLRR